MEQMMLGEIRIEVQNEVLPNEDVYMISGDFFGNGKANHNEISNLLADNIEDPERFVLNEEGSRVNVYTKQPNAAVQLAVFLNLQKGITVSEKEIESVRQSLIQRQ